MPDGARKLSCPPAEIGEIAVKGDLVTRNYFENREADSLAKIRDGKDTWHRMGDLGWADTKGRIWFCGRKSHRVQTPSGTLYTIPCEAIFNNHPDVLRSALVGVGKPPNQKPVIIIQTRQAGSSLHGNDLHGSFWISRKKPADQRYRYHSVSHGISGGYSA